MGDAVGEKTLAKSGAFIRRWRPPLDAMTAPERLALAVCEPRAPRAAPHFPTIVQARTPLDANHHARATGAGG